MLLSVSVFVLAGGCTFNSQGRDKDVGYFSIKEPRDLVGLKKGELITRLGLPDRSVTDELGREYWQYSNSNKYYILVFGRGKQKHLLIRIANGVVDAVSLIGKGDSMDMLTVGF